MRISDVFKRLLRNERLKGLVAYHRQQQAPQQQVLLLPELEGEAVRTGGGSGVQGVRRLDLLAMKRVILGILLLLLTGGSPFAQQRAVVRDWTVESALGRFGYWKVTDFGEMPPGNDHCFFFGAFGQLSIGSSGFIPRPRPALGIVSGLIIVALLVRWRLLALRRSGKPTV